MQQVLTVEMVAARWGCSKSFVYSEIDKGRLTAMRFGPKLLRITQAAVEAYEAGATVETPPTPASAIAAPVPFDPHASARLLRVANR